MVAGVQLQARKCGRVVVAGGGFGGRAQFGPLNFCSIAVVNIRAEIHGEIGGGQFGLPGNRDGFVSLQQPAVVTGLDIGQRGKQRQCRAGRWGGEQAAANGNQRQKSDAAGRAQKMTPGNEIGHDLVSFIEQRNATIISY